MQSRFDNMWHNEYILERAIILYKNKKDRQNNIKTRKKSLIVISLSITTQYLVLTPVLQSQPQLLPFELFFPTDLYQD